MLENGPRAAWPAERWPQPAPSSIEKEPLRGTVWAYGPILFCGEAWRQRTDVRASCKQLTLPFPSDKCGTRSLRSLISSRTSLPHRPRVALHPPALPALRAFTAKKRGGREGRTDDNQHQDPPPG